MGARYRLEAKLSESLREAFGHCAKVIEQCLTNGTINEIHRGLGRSSLSRRDRIGVNAYRSLSQVPIGVSAD